jgi:hypothetical protein
MAKCTEKRHGAMMRDWQQTQPPERQQLVADLLKQLEQLIGRVEFGKVELVFHQGRLVQLEKTEKLRVD